ncbi:MAG: hypothetical protein HY744_25185, partial [Deltaproteobacteria bacterium]|nr:hypothetical protein [Deltaproteobacteria bacterium]
MTRADFKHRPSHRDRRSPLGAVLLVASALFGAPAASADVVQEPPEQCPAGSTGDTSHCGPRCAPRICTDVAQCAAGELCQPRALCLTQMECWPHYPEDAGPSYQDKVEGPCPAQAPCAVGTCQTLKVCAPPPPPP